MAWRDCGPSFRAWLIFRIGNLFGAILSAPFRAGVTPAHLWTAAPTGGLAGGGRGAPGRMSGSSVCLCLAWPSGCLVQAQLRHRGAAALEMPACSHYFVIPASAFLRASVFIFFQCQKGEEVKR